MIYYTRPNYSSFMKPYIQRSVIMVQVERESESCGDAESGGEFKGGVG